MVRLQRPRNKSSIHIQRIGDQKDELKSPVDKGTHMHAIDIEKGLHPTEQSYELTERRR